ncbi:hypothetical protein [Pedobacter metabolipauper]|uniref:Uncharacterized protein n=1 Tax=Pedobacter metabolipauper TaxID=425513 RepID=A0A4R6SUH7_9SPHI|nr:hypothetical protein [Pedobacter metabolipauper]TDQ09370.1 hypothetical protein ATK78_1524 [Pedobacter metabolipauper]
MINYFVRLLGSVVALGLLFSCSSTNNKPLLIDFSADSTSIVIRNIDHAGILQLRSGSVSDSALHELVSVLQTPFEQDTSIKELPLDGKIEVTDRDVIFKPASRFIPGNDYMVITFLNANFGHADQVMKGSLDYKLKPQQKLLTR